MTIIESRPPESLHIRLDVQRPMADTAESHFTFQADGSATTVTWVMTGCNGFVGKAANLVLNIEQMIGEILEKRLANLRGVAETEAASKEKPALPGQDQE